MILSAAISLAFVTALSVYISSEPMLSRETAGPDLPAAGDASPGVASEGAKDKSRARLAPSPEARERTAADRRTGKRATPRARENARPWRERLSRLASQVDDAAVRFRSNLADTEAVQVAEGCADLQAGRYEAAVARFDRALAKAPEDAAALSAKAAALVAMQQFEDAAKIYDALVRVAPREANARYNYGVVLYRLSRFGEAAEQFRHVAELEPDDDLALYNLATLAQRAGRLNEARQAWEAFTRLQPNVSSGWFNLGVVWMDFGEPLEAAVCFSRATNIDPQAADGWLNLGLAYAAAGHWEAAVEAMTKADGLAPCNATITRRLAELHEFLADQGGPDSEEHRRLAASMAEQAD